MSPDILSIVQIFGEITETWLYDQIASIRRYNIHVATFKYKNQFEYPYHSVTLLPEPNPKRFTSKLWKLPAWLPGQKEPSIDPMVGAQILDLIKRYNVRCIQAHFGRMGYKFREFAKTSSIPYIAWFYGADVFRVSRKWHEKLNEIFRSNIIVCCNSHALRNELIALGAGPEKVFVFHLGTKIPAEPTPKSILKGNPLKIISVGRLVDLKDPVGSVQIASILRDRGLKFTWEYIGDGELKSSMISEIHKNNLDNFFHLTGYLPYHQVWEKLKTSDIMVHNGVVAPDGGREAFGVVLIEASSAGLPIVSVRVGGISEIIQNNKTGILLEERDYEGMADNIIYLSKNPELRAELGNAGYQYVKENFDLEKQAAKLECFYDELIK